MPTSKLGAASLVVVLCVASFTTGQELDVSSVMQSQVRPALQHDDSYVPGSDGAASGGDYQFAAWLQPPSQPGFATSQPAVRRGATASRLAGTSLASVPNMFGDLPLSTAVVALAGIDGQRDIFFSQFSLPLNSAGRSGKLAENDSPIPQDRVFFNYNHFHNVFQLNETPLTTTGSTVFRQEPLDRYTLGGEKTFTGGWTSIEVRMPFNGIPDPQLQSVGVNADSIGNLTVVFKTLLSMSDTTAVGAGMAIATPTGSDTFVRLASTNVRFQNESTHLLPYIGFVWAPGDPRWGWSDRLFLTGYAQLDLAASSNSVDIVAPGGVATSSVGRLTDQNLGFLDIGAGYWLFRDPDAPRLTGVAVVSELHYTTALTDADQLVGIGNDAIFAINNTDRRFDVLNATIGVQMLIFEASSFRVAGVFPLGDEDRRLFDSEVQLQFNRRF
jgi:hypothetical protein